MKQIVTYFKPSMLRAVELALHRLKGSSGMSFSEVRGVGPDQIPRMRPPLIYDLSTCNPYISVEILSSDDRVSEIVSTIEAAANLRQAGNGKIYILDCYQADTGKAGAQDQAALAFT